jgi:HlyD family secretion protein
MAETTAKPIVKKKKKSKKLLFFIIAGVLLILIVSAVVISGKKEKATVVQTEKVSTRNITQVVSGTGTINPETKVDISAEVSGEIINLPIKEGQEVNKGDLLVKIKPDIYNEKVNQQQASINYSRSQVEVAENNLKKTELELQRTEQLYQKGLISQSDLDNARIAFEVAKSNVKSSNANVRQNIAILQQTGQDLNKTTIKAPMDGIITKLNSQLGEKVVGTQLMSGSVIMTVSDLSVMNANIEVSETDITQVKIGDTADVSVDAFPDKIVKGYVLEISNSATTKGTGTQDQIINFIVKVRIVDNDVDLKPGMSCNADIKVNSKFNVLSVPIQSITARDEMKKEENKDPDQIKRTTEENSKKKEKPREVVFVVEDGNPAKVKMVTVKTGISDDKYIEVSEGLTPEMVVVKGPYKAISKDLEEGGIIKVDNEMKKPINKE